MATLEQVRQREGTSATSKLPTFAELARFHLSRAGKKDKNINIKIEIATARTMAEQEYLAASQIAKRDRLLDLAIKWCDKKHPDWEEIKTIYDELCFDDLRDSGGIKDAP